MKYQFQFTSFGERDFARLPHAIQKQIMKKLDFFEASGNPFHYAKKLEGHEKTYRVRIGDYRVIFTPKNEEIFVILLILKVGHRREIYES